jgi:hypothetical protein
VLGLAACGSYSGGDDDDDDICYCIRDSGPNADTSPNEPDCNPVSQTGCARGEKCAVRLVDPGTGAGNLACVPDGALALGEVCPEPTQVGAWDDCERGGACYDGTCLSICTTVNDQCPIGKCTETFDGDGNRLPIDLCIGTAVCDPLLQDCGSTACYPYQGSEICLSPGGGLVGDACSATNGCLKGIACVPASDSLRICRTLCGPWPDCVDTTGRPIACGCGATVACAADEACLPIDDGTGGALHEIAGACIPAADIAFVCP